MFDWSARSMFFLRLKVGTIVIKKYRMFMKTGPQLYEVYKSNNVRCSIKKSWRTTDSVI